MAKLRLLILFGGASNEYETSCRTAAAILHTLEDDRFEIVPVGISKKGRWLYFPGETEEIGSGKWIENPDCSPAILSPDPAHRGILIMEDGSYTLKRIDVVFSVLMGKYGEDGAVQGLCELSHIPYVGNSILGSAICRSKAVTHSVLSAAHIPMPHWTTVAQRNMSRLEHEYDRIEELLEYPVYVKPSGCNSAVASGIAANRAELAAHVKRAFTQDSTVLVEELVHGREFRIGVFGYDLPFASFVGELKDGTLTVPADLDDTTSQTIRELAITAFQALECRSLALFDLFYTERGDILFGEVNTLPELTEQAIYPALMGDLGMRFRYLLEKLIEQAIEHADR